MNKNLNIINKIQKDLEELNKYQVVIYGSYLSEYYIANRSDIDIAVITQKKDKEANITIWKNLMGEFDKEYDIKIFELLPLFVQIEVIENYQVLFGDELDISEYFYHYRKIWEDMENRIESNRFTSISEKMTLIEKRK